MEKTNLPEKKFRAGPVTATVWKNDTKNSEGNTVTYRTVTIDKNYKDKEGRWRSTNSLHMNDLPKASLVLNKAYEHLALTESDDVQVELQ